MEEHIEQLPQADWVDQDLLTKDLAASLLEGEIVAERGRLARFDRGDRSGLFASRADMQRRLAAMLVLQAGMTSPTPTLVSSS